jgi:hypothetical protein
LQSSVFVADIFPDRVARAANIHAIESEEAALPHDTIILDATDIPSDSITSLKMDGIRYEGSELAVYNSEDKFHTLDLTMYLNVVEGELKHFGGKQITMKIYYVQESFYDYNLANVDNQHLDAWIEGTALCLKYRYDIPKGVAILPEWDFLGYRNGIYAGVTEEYFGGLSSTSGTVDIYISGDTEPEH